MLAMTARETALCRHDTNGIRLKKITEINGSKFGAELPFTNKSLKLARSDQHAGT